MMWSDLCFKKDCFAYCMENWIWIGKREKEISNKAVAIAQAKNNDSLDCSGSSSDGEMWKGCCNQIIS